jgi:hypothetical protein
MAVVIGKMFARFMCLGGVVLALGGCPEGDSSQVAMTLGGTVSDGVDSSGDGGTPDDDGNDDGDGACILNNCSSDAECSDCSDGRNTCFEAEKRCVQCAPGGDGSECADGEKCTEFGNCVPADLDCPTDGDGNPTIQCGSADDCAACDPLHQVCADGACVACTADDTSACQTTDQCVDNQCVSSCPESCTSDSECANCGSEGHEAHACHQHQCAQCSETVPCPAGEECNSHGVCTPICGIPGQVPGTCEADADCAGCQGDNTTCNAPINGGHGVCGPSAAGCSDLGNGVVVLPAPFDQVTNLCSEDGDCDGIGVMYNVGELLRDLTGLNSIDDAIIEYPMSKCADVTVGAGGVSISCGVCVPCETSDDCMDIDIDQVADDAFGPLGAIATAILLDQLFGDNEHLIHMFCQPVAAGYGVCLPCPTLLNDCAGGGGGGSGMCNHDACTAGDALDPTCGNCAASVCAQDDFCCNNEWDDVCVDQAEELCNCGGGGGTCHDQCEAGPALSPACNACVSAICNNDPFCCQSEWDDVCVMQVDTLCDGECTGGGCAHSPCQIGGALESACDPCVTGICSGDAFCCDSEWDQLCVDSAEAECAECSGGSGCAHDECVSGPPLASGCSACATAICNADAFCCDTMWDSMCVDAAGNSGSCSC